MSDDSYRQPWSCSSAISAHGGNPVRPIVEARHELQCLATGSPELLESDVPDFVDRLQAVGQQSLDRSP